MQNLGIHLANLAISLQTLN